MWRKTVARGASRKFYEFCVKMVENEQELNKRKRDGEQSEPKNVLITTLRMGECKTLFEQTSKK